MSNDTENLKVDQGDNGKRRTRIILNIPTALTILRVFAIPPLVYLAHFPDQSAAAWATTVFVAASITDWLDGYLARKMVCPLPQLLCATAAIELL
jgi:hypothetical protein